MSCISNNIDKSDITNQTLGMDLREIKIKQTGNIIEADCCGGPLYIVYSIPAICHLNEALGIINTQVCYWVNSISTVLTEKLQIYFDEILLIATTGDMLEMHDILVKNSVNKRFNSEKELVEASRKCARYTTKWNYGVNPLHLNLKFQLYSSKTVSFQVMEVFLSS